MKYSFITSTAVLGALLALIGIKGWDATGEIVMTNALTCFGGPALCLVGCVIDIALDLRDLFK